MSTENKPDIQKTLVIQTWAAHIAAKKLNQKAQDVLDSMAYFSLLTTLTGLVTRNVHLIPENIFNNPHDSPAQIIIEALVELINPTGNFISQSEQENQKKIAQAIEKATKKAQEIDKETKRVHIDNPANQNYRTLKGNVPSCYWLADSDIDAILQKKFKPDARTRKINLAGAKKVIYIAKAASFDEHSNAIADQLALIKKESEDTKNNDSYTVYMPLNKGGSHWVYIKAEVSSGKTVIHYYDSMAGDDNNKQAIIASIKEQFSSERIEAEIFPHFLANQKDGHTCGDRVIHGILKDLNPEDNIAKIDIANGQNADKLRETVFTELNQIYNIHPENKPPENKPQKNMDASNPGKHKNTLFPPAKPAKKVQMNTQTPAAELQKKIAGIFKDEAGVKSVNLENLPKTNHGNVQCNNGEKIEVEKEKDGVSFATSGNKPETQELLIKAVLKLLETLGLQKDTPVIIAMPKGEEKKFIDLCDKHQLKIKNRDDYKDRLMNKGLPPAPLTPPPALPPGLPPMPGFPPQPR